MKSVTIIIPTYNSERTIQECIHSIVKQKYPHKDLEMIFADGGSTDRTLEIIGKFQQSTDIHIEICKNDMRDAEAGKAVGVRMAHHEILCFIDSDNILPNAMWLQRMIKPFDESNIVASEPIAYTYRRQDNALNRYAALIGMGDPLCMFTGNYDRWNRITNKWTEVAHEEQDRGSYLSVRFMKGMIPTIGANGFLMRKKALLCHLKGDHLFDIDVLYELISKNNHIRVAKVKTGIVHLFCPDLKTFYRKQDRRIKDFLFFHDKQERTYPWNKVNKIGMIRFILDCVFVLPLIVQAGIGFSKVHDLKAWSYHIAACWVTLIVYGGGVLGKLFGRKGMASRDGWKQ